MSNSKEVKMYRVAVVLLLLAAGTIYVMQLNYFQVGMAWDDAQYVQLAMSIAHGRPYMVDVGFGETFPTRYPFGFPLLLAPAYSLFNGDFRALQGVSVLFTLATTCLLIAGRKQLGFPNRWFALGIAALYALSPLVVGTSRMVMSEPAFLFFAVLAMILTTRKATGRQDAVVSAIGLGVVWLFASHTRSVGVTLLAASILYLALRHDWRRMTLALCGFGVSLSLIAALTSLNLSDTFNLQFYLNELTNRGEWRHTSAQTDLIPRAAQGALAYGQRHLPEALIPFAGSTSLNTKLFEYGLGFLPALLSLALLAFITIGFIRNVRSQRLQPVHLYVVFYIVVTVLWPFEGARFLYGIVPFLFGYLLLGVAAPGGIIVFRLAASRDRRRYLYFAGVGCLVLFIGLQATASLRSDSWKGHTRDLTVGARWVRDNTPVDALVVADHYELLYPYLLRATTWLPPELPEVRKLVEEQPLVYLMIAPVVEWSPNGQLVYSEKEETFLRALKDGTLPGDLVFEDAGAKVEIYRLKRSG